jgi:hypothetical protein
VTTTDETSTTTARNYDEYENKRVRLVHKVVNEETDTGLHDEEVHGKIEAVNTDNQVLMIRPKGKTMGFLVFFKDIVEFEEDQEAVKLIKQSVLKELKLGEGRQHLLTRHALLLDAVNGMTEEIALDFHSKIDHAPLGHTHQSSDSESEGSDDSTAPAEA